MWEVLILCYFQQSLSTFSPHQTTRLCTLHEQETQCKCIDINLPNISEKWQKLDFWYSAAPIYWNNHHPPSILPSKTKKQDPWRVSVLQSMMLQCDWCLVSWGFNPSLPSQIHTSPFKRRCPSPAPWHATPLSVKEHIKPSLDISLILPLHFPPFIFFQFFSKHDLLSWHSFFTSSILLLPPGVKLLSLLSVTSSASVIWVWPAAWISHLVDVEEKRLFKKQSLQLGDK